MLRQRWLHEAAERLWDASELLGKASAAMTSAWRIQQRRSQSQLPSVLTTKHRR
jgi:hypothetical protein